MRSSSLLLPVLLVQAYGFQSSVPRTSGHVRNSRLGFWVPPPSALQSSVAPFQNDTAAIVASSSYIITTAARGGDRPKAQLVQRSAVAGVSCVTTWAMIQYASLSAVQASSVQGLVACLLATTTPLFAAASFCGSFAGMSGQIASAGQAAVLGAFCAAVFYWWETTKIQLGKGGRLGTMAFIANLAYFVCRHGTVTFLVDALNILRPSTAVAVLLSAAAVVASRKKNNPADGKQSPSLSLRGAAVPKAALFAALVARFVLTSANGATAAVTKLVPSALSMYAASLIVKKSAGVVLPVALVGLAGSFMGALAAPIYLGAFIGMTGLKDFGPGKLLQSSVLSTVLLELGLFNGFGGKLGFLSFLGVNFAM